jgi:hypothetical protein
MISKSYIDDTLKKLGKLYSDSRTFKETELYAKLAIIELCGWAEDSFDDIISWYVNNKLLDKNNIKFCIKEIVNKNYSIDYENHIRPMFYKIVGFKKLETIENKLNKNGDIDKLKALLNSLKKNRDKAAHTHTKYVTRSFDAPIKLYQDFIVLFKIIKKIENEIRS